MWTAKQPSRNTRLSVNQLYIIIQSLELISQLPFIWNLHLFMFCQWNILYIPRVAWQTQTTETHTHSHGTIKSINAHIEL